MGNSLGVRYSRVQDMDETGKISFDGYVVRFYADKFCESVSFRTFETMCREINPATLVRYLHNEDNRDQDGLDEGVDDILQLIAAGHGFHFNDRWYTLEEAAAYVLPEMPAPPSGPSDLWVVDDDGIYIVRADSREEAAKVFEAHSDTVYEISPLEFVLSDGRMAEALGWLVRDGSAKNTRVIIEELQKILEENGHGSTDIVAEVRRMSERLAIDPGGSDAIDALEQAIKFLRSDIENLKKPMKVAIEIEGGMVASVFGEREVEAVLVDRDTAVTREDRIAKVWDADAAVEQIPTGWNSQKVAEAFQAAGEVER